MEAGWELFAMGMGMEFDASPDPAAAATAYMYGLPSTDTLRIDDLLDFSNHDFSSSSSSSSSSSAAAAAAANADGHLTMNPTINTNIHFGGSSSFPDDLYTIHSEEAAELEWLSQFVEDSFSVDMIPNPTPTPTATTTTGATAHLPPATGRGARSKRSRPHVINAAWSSSISATSSSSSSTTSSELLRPSSGRKRSGGARGEAEEGGPRRCTHCQSEKTPQWRLGPKGPKTLCNACGVRYKSGRLVHEYRPAASPTFVLSQHSNSHRKVLELRRQNEMLHLHGHDAGKSSSRFLDYEVC